MISRKHTSRTASRRIRSVEALELRRMLDGAGVWSVETGVSVSFVADGTEVGPKDSQLFGHFEHLGEPDAWQEAILRGFQTWARETSINVPTVNDDGSDIGVPGKANGDGRFGDVRVSGVAMTSDIFASSISTDQTDGLTWGGDLVFNTQKHVDSLDDLYALSVREAGRVFGISESTDEASPMFGTDIPTSATPTVDDLAALDELYGSRRPDAFEMVDENGADQVAILLLASDDPSVPTMIFGDLQSSDDVDSYHVAGLADTKLAVRLVSEGISQLRPTLTLRTTDGTVLAVSEFEERSNFGQVVFVGDLPTIHQDDLVLEVTSSMDNAPYDAGGYTLIVSPGEDSEMRDFPNDANSQCIPIISRVRDRSLTNTVIQSALSTCSKKPFEFFLTNQLGAVPILGPEPVDITEASFCGHDYLDQLFSCLVAGDIDGDGQVDFSDFLIISDNFGDTDATKEDGDVDNDGAVNFSDFLIVSRGFARRVAGQPPVYEVQEDTFSFPFADSDDQDPFDPIFVASQDAGPSLGHPFN